jgi:hypothetical protein
MDLRLIFLPLTVIYSVLVGVWWFVRPEHFFWLLLAILVHSFISAWWLTRSRKDWPIFALLPLFLFASGLSYALTISVQNVAIAIVAVSILGTILYWRLVFLYTFKQSLYRPFSLERLSSYLSFLTIYFSAAALFGVKIFLNIPDIQLFGAMGLVVAAISIQWLWFQKVSLAIGWVYGITTFLVVTEIFLIVGYLPINFHLLGFCVAIVWYAVSTLLGYQLAKTLNLTRVRLVLIISLGILLAALLTARWF